MIKHVAINTIKTDKKFQIFPVNNDEVIQGICSSIKANGFDEATPIVLWESVIIDGHTRFTAAKQAGMTKIPVVETDFETEEAAIEYAIHMQRDRRNLTDAEYFYAYEKLDERKKKGENLKTYERDKDGHTVKPGKGQTTFTGKSSRQQTAEKLGTSDTKVKQMRSIFDYGNPEVKQGVKSGNKSINAAYEEVKVQQKEKKKTKIQSVKKEKEFTEIAGGLFIGKSTQNPTSKFNEQKSENIEWAKWSWNPITGCRHGCPYCYARDISNRYKWPTKFEATLYPDRMTDPSRTKIPEHRKDEIGIDTVFVCSMADLFGDWVPQEWIDEVIAAVALHEKWNFIFLTKNPKRYIGIEWPSNAWVGTTVDTQKKVEAAVETFSQINANVKFLSCEPLSEHLQFNADEFDIEGEWLSVFNWVIIGGQSRTSGMDAAQPKWQWVESLHNQARNAGCAIYWKPNLLVKPKEYPVENDI